MLHAIWMTCVGLFAVSIVAMGALLALRFVRRRRERGEKAVQARLAKQIVLWLHEPDANIDEMREAARRTPRQASELLARAVELLQGDEQARLVRLGRELGLLAFMLGELANGKPEHRQKSAEKLAFFDTEETVLALASALNDPYSHLRLAAARSLASLGHHVPPQILRDVQWGDSALVHDLFEKLAMRQAEDLIALARDRQATTGRRICAFQALASTGDYALIPIFSALAAESLPELRAVAASGLGRLGHPKAQGVLAPLLDDGDYHVRASAAQAVGAIQLTGLYEDVGRLLDDDNWWVRFTAAKALAAGGVAGHRILRVAEAGTLANARDMAAMMLLEHGGANA